MVKHNKFVKPIALNVAAFVKLSHKSELLLKCSEQNNLEIIIEGVFQCCFVVWAGAKKIKL